MKRTGPVITRAEAFELSKDSAELLLRDLTAQDVPLLDESRYLEAPGCWMFFRNPSIVIPPQHALRDCAFVVSRHGDLRTIVDYTHNPAQLAAYLRTMSDYFVKNEQVAEGPVEGDASFERP